MFQNIKFCWALLLYRIFLNKSRFFFNFTTNKNYFNKKNTDFYPLLCYMKGAFNFIQKISICKRILKDLTIRNKCLAFTTRWQCVLYLWNNYNNKRQNSQLKIVFNLLFGALILKSKFLLNNFGNFAGLNIFVVNS